MSLTVALLACAAALFAALAAINRHLAFALFCGLLPTYLLRLQLPGGLPTTFLEIAFVKA